MRPRPCRPPIRCLGRARDDTEPRCARGCGDVRAHPARRSLRAARRPRSPRPGTPRAPISRSDGVAHPCAREHPRRPDLTDREREVLALIAEGRDNAGIAHRLQVSTKTVSNHISNIFAKLRVSDRAQAIVAAREAGLGRGA
ncbi:helix-turn-helix transcriptional regulator [Agromyces sp. SYSU T00194]|uniref:helix-turn-helix transcriptional regulator n=1 Tax=Agromyces chitinivorans TaxID=3158560 RepID=UPI00339AAB16